MEASRPVPDFPSRPLEFLDVVFPSALGEVFRSLDEFVDMKMCGLVGFGSRLFVQVGKMNGFVVGVRLEHLWAHNLLKEQTAYSGKDGQNVCKTIDYYKWKSGAYYIRNKQDVFGRVIRVIQ
jgi:hypothetical protein